MNLADPELELIDPTPNVHALYDRGGLCDIALSEPLLKLRPRKDLIETLLHEMIHAYLFVTHQDQDRDGHGPNFKSHMHRINNSTGLNISIYHDFHDEVELYQTHWWRCNGPCQNKKPRFGIVRRSMNKAPGPNDYWWKSHQRQCGGTFIKIKEPEKGKKQRKKDEKANGDISKMISNLNNTKINEIYKPILKDSSNILSKSKNTNAPNYLSDSVTKKSNKTDTTDVLEKVRNVWANKTIPSLLKPIDTNTSKRSSIHITTGNSDLHSHPPKKMKKIDDYFKTTATNILKDLYGQDFIIKDEKNGDNKVVAVPVSCDNSLVHCPVCNVKIKNDEVNSHLDECLNKEELAKLNNNNEIIEIGNDQNNVKLKTENSFVDSVDRIKNLVLLKPTIKEYPMTKIEINTVTIVAGKQLNKIKVEEDCKVEEQTIKKSYETQASRHDKIKLEQTCPCCGSSVDKKIEEHLDECLSFFGDDNTIPEEGASTSFADRTIIIDDDNDICDETLTMNATGTKHPCPCCMKMIEAVDMNNHLDVCLAAI
ncbi:unnamed protein product [Leptidea sinapis]|uniref:Protein with SprT-like domain at the N terminus n=1 Tax=Leptidea sinapis TaxID=189913 RepID=A0A5E4QUD8_9NEOP|nr:unnamed protein product [Leptidea sinapis]